MLRNTEQHSVTLQSARMSAKSKSKSLGAWFPAATVRKVAALGPTERCTILLFYHYVRPKASLPS